MIYVCVGMVEPIIYSHTLYHKIYLETCYYNAITSEKKMEINKEPVVQRSFSKNEIKKIKKSNFPTPKIGKKKKKKRKG